MGAAESQSSPAGALEGLECVDCTHRKGKVRGISLAVSGSKSIAYVQLFIAKVSFCTSIGIQ